MPLFYRAFGARQIAMLLSKSRASGSKNSRLVKLIVYALLLKPLAKLRPSALLRAAR